MSLKRNREINILAPGRICLFGDHQDYLGLPVIACAINRYIHLKAVPNSDNVLKINLPDINQVRIIDLEKESNSGKEKDYFLTALNVLKKQGFSPMKGFDVLITGDIPVNAGLSSSSAVIVAWIKFLLEICGNTIPMTSEQVAKLAYQTEVLEYNSPGGLMDQYTISIGNLLHLNTVTGEHRIINKQLNSLIIGESGIPKQTLGVLSNLNGMAKEAIKMVKENNSSFTIEKATIEDYEMNHTYVTENLKPIFYAAIKNHEITQAAFKTLLDKKTDLKQVGRLLTAHHSMLKDNLGISVPIIDQMIKGALTSGALGAKIVGSGGGGCIVALSKPGEEDSIIQGMLDGGAKAAYKVAIVGGAHVKDIEYDK